MTEVQLPLVSSDGVVLGSFLRREALNSLQSKYAEWLESVGVPVTVNVSYDVNGTESVLFSVLADNESFVDGSYMNFSDCFTALNSSRRCVNPVFKRGLCLVHASEFKSGGFVCSLCKKWREKKYQISGSLMCKLCRGE